MAVSPTAVIERVNDALNRHDLEAFVACLAADYQSTQPAHPERDFRGVDQVRKNWSAIFAAVSDFSAEAVRTVADGDVAWTEWHWTGRRQDGGALDMRGVTLFGVRDGLIAWGRLYMEEVEATGTGIDASVRKMVATDPGQG